MNSVSRYIVGFFKGLWSLIVGMYTTGRIFFRRKVTECYPENRKDLKMFDRFRGELALLHNEKNQHKCIACGICEMNCPNGTIRLTTEMETDEAGKKKKVLIRYQYDHGSCLYCQLCVRSCPQDALAFVPTFEHAVYTRAKLVYKLNQEGSSLAPKPVVTPTA